MTIQLPLAAFSLVSSSLANDPRAESYTLTLRLTPPLASPYGERMSGKVKAVEFPVVEGVCARQSSPPTVRA
jgi:hypothetical protein